MSECGYSHSDDFYNEITCSLPEGHEGSHRASYEWETRPLDVCVAKGHEWGEWEPVKPRETGDITDLLRDTLMLAPGRPPIKEPTTHRQCMRCRQEQDNGKYHSSGLFPILTFHNKIPRIAKYVEFGKP